MIMQMVFGGNDQQSTLFNTQLLGAFGPDDKSGDQGKTAASLMKAFGGGSTG
jgi:hypothetical protein